MSKLLERKKKFINHKLLKQDKLLKRKYQVDIFVTCSKKNCLVVIPTGLGKTIIALLLSIHQLKNEDSKIIFLAPTRPLVEQHLETFKEMTNLDEDTLLMMTGALIPDKRKKLYGEEIIRCLFMTPQILQNDLISNRISLEDVSLIIFDEAHRASGKYAYNFIAKKYIQQAQDPKILAMTASPGKDREKIEEVIDNLFLNAVEIRTESDPDVKPYIQEVKTIWKDVELPEEMKDILDNIKKLQKNIYKELKDNEILDTSSISKITRKKILIAGKKLDVLIIKANQGQDLPRLLFCKKLYANALRLSHMSELIEAQGINAFKAYLDKNIEKVSNNQGGKSLQELFNSQQMEKIIQQANILVKGNIDHPKMGMLMSLLMKQFNNNKDSRILIFCHFRDTVRNIVNEINKNELINASRFIGQQKKSKHKGLTQKEQMKILQQFKDGEFNTLVSTSVGEEGLDISECDVVIFYDIVPSEIRAIQRRGRTGRNKSGKVILLKTKGTREEGYFWAEKYREKKMKRVLNEIRNDLSGKKSKLAKGQKSLTSFMKQSTNNKLKKGEKKKEKKGKRKEENNGEKKGKGKEEKKRERKEEKKRERKEEKKRDGKGEKKEKKNRHIEKENNNKNNNTNNVKTNTSSHNFSMQTGTSSKISILVDSRETASPVTRELSERNANIDLKRLQVGDYIISKRCGIERKSIQDFVDSLKDGRLFDELKRLKDQFSLPILILEGNLKKAVTLKRAALLGALTSILLKMNILLIQTSSPEETAEMIIALAKKEQIKKKYTKNIRFKKAPENIPKQLEFIISGIPNINAARAKDLLIEFRTLQKLFNADEEELQTTPNIGPVLAKKIYGIGRSDYLQKDQKDQKKR